MRPILRTSQSVASRRRSFSSAAREQAAKAAAEAEAAKAAEEAGGQRRRPSIIDGDRDVHAAAAAAATAAAASGSSPPKAKSRLDRSDSTIRRRSITAMSTLAKLNTRLHAREEHLTHIQARKEVREMVIYMVFVCVLSLSVLIGRNSSSGFYFKERVVKQFTEVEIPQTHAHVPKYFGDIATVEETFQWMWGPMLQAAYTSHTFDGDQREGQTRPGYMLGQDMLVGGVRVSVQRSPAMSCDSVPQVMRDSLGAGVSEEEQFGCVKRFSSSFFDLPAQEETAPYGGDAPLCPYDYDYTAPPADGCAGGAPQGPFTYAAWDEPAFLSETGFEYHAGGYSVVLPNRNETLARQLVNTLYDANFIDQQTRVLIVDFTTYNPNHGLFAVVRLMAEMPTTGGVFTTEHNYVLRFYQMETTWDYVRVACEAATLAMVFMYAWIEVLTVRKAVRDGRGRQWMRAASNWFHVANLLFYVIVVFLRVMTFAFLLPEDYDVAGDEYVSFRSAGQYLRLAEKLNAINTLLCWLKLFRALRFIPKFSQLTDTMAAAASGVATFAVMALIVGVGASMAHTLAFGTQISGYRTMTQAAYSLLRSLLGDFDFEELYKADQSIGPLLFVIYVCLSVFVLLNILIVIISDAYAIVQENLASKSHDFKVGEAIRAYIWQSLLKVPVLGLLLGLVYDWLQSRVRERSQRRATLRAKVAEAVAEHQHQEITATVAVYLTQIDRTDESELDFDEFLALFRYVLSVRELKEALERTGSRPDLTGVAVEIMSEAADVPTQQEVTRARALSSSSGSPESSPSSSSPTFAPVEVEMTPVPAAAPAAPAPAASDDESPKFSYTWLVEHAAASAEKPEGTSEGTTSQGEGKE